MSSDNRLSQVLQLCELDRNVLQELRSLYNSLWNGFLTLKFRRLIDPVVLRHAAYLAEVDCDNALNYCIQRACQFFADVCQAVRDGYDAEIRDAGGGELAVTLEDEKLAELSVLQAKYEKEPHELVRLMQACLQEESRLLARTTASAATAASASSDCPQSLSGPAGQKRPSSSSDSALLEDALATNRKLRRLAVESPAPDLASLESELRRQHSALRRQLDRRQSLINSPSGGQDADRLARELSCLLDSLSRLYEANGQLGWLAELAGDLLARSLVILRQDDQVIKQKKSNYCLAVRCLAAEFVEPDRLYEIKVGLPSDDPSEPEPVQPVMNPSRTVRHSRELDSRIELRFGFPKLPASRSARRGRGLNAASTDVCAQKRALEASVQLLAPRLGHPNLRAAARSLPVVFITHDQQKPAAYATVCYDELFRRTEVFGDDEEGDRRGFEVAPSVPVDRALLMLDCLARRQLMQPLLPAHFDYFRRKLSAMLDQTLTQEVTFDQLAKSKLASLGHRSLWDFYYQCVRLIKQSCLSLWRHRLLYGFVEKAEAERLVLAAGRPGSFLVRLSESTGRLSVTRCCRCLADQPAVGEGFAGVFAESLDPFDDAELQATPLANRLFNDPSLAWMLDGEGQLLAKSAALASHVTDAGPPAAEGYVPRRSRRRSGCCPRDCLCVDASSQLESSLPGQ